MTAIGVFGSDERRITSDRFSGAEHVSVFCDALVGFRETEVRTRPESIETVSVFGDAEIRVPDEWDVRIETLNVFGDTVDRCPNQSTKHAESVFEMPDNELDLWLDE